MAPVNFNSNPNYGAYSSVANYQSPQSIVDPGELQNAISLWGNPYPGYSSGPGSNMQSSFSNMATSAPSFAAPNADPSFWDNMMAGKYGSMQGYGALAKGAGSVLGAWEGYQANKLARKQFEFNKSTTQQNFDNQVAVTNEALRARQGGRDSFNRNKVTPTQLEKFRVV